MLRDAQTLICELFEGQGRKLGASPSNDSQDSVLTAMGPVDGRSTIAVAGDIEVIGTADAPIVTKKLRHALRVSKHRGVPLVFLISPEASSLTDVGGTGYGPEESIDLFKRERETPWATAVFGQVRGTAALHAAMSDFVVTVQDFESAADDGGFGVASPPDQVVRSGQDALSAIRTFLGFLPGHNNDFPQMCDSGAKGPVLPIHEELNVRELVDRILDPGGLFELRAQDGHSVVTGLGRIDGSPVGVLAHDRSVEGGMAEDQALVKAIRLLTLCDSFNLPIVQLIDQDGEPATAQPFSAPLLASSVSALALATVPKISLVIGHSNGLQALACGLIGGVDEMAAWSMADVGICPSSQNRSVFRLAEMFRVHSVLEAAETRPYLQRTLAMFRTDAAESPRGRHLLAAWPHF